jgi:sialic acid synthase SpsE/D-lyxose ketol-isomerase
MISDIPDNLFVLEMANNHMGDVNHGLMVIQQFGEECRKFPFNFAFKLQYRNLETFVHPEARGRDDIKYVKRFSETALTRADFDRLVAAMRENGFLAIATPFDEPSVDVIEDQKLDIIKIASCAFTDWPLLERVVLTNKPIIASTAGASLGDIDRVVSFFKHRRKDFAILHCVGEYPTPEERMHLSQIDFLKARYPGVRIGFSTHEDPGNLDMVKLAIAKGATIFEKHVGVPTGRYALNNYSATPQQVQRWLGAARDAWTMCGVGDTRLPANEAEMASLQSLRRGVFARRVIHEGETIAGSDVFFAFPPQPSQYSANNWSKYASFKATRRIEKNGALTTENVSRRDVREQIYAIAQRVKKFIGEAHVTVPGEAELEISHHYGLDRFDEVGLTMLTVINRGYCKKLLVLLPGQSHPEQFHKQKEETFHVLHGEIRLELDGKTSVRRPGDVVTVEPGVHHAFSSESGAVIEEISSTHFTSDSFYADPAINANQERKTSLAYWMG